MRNDHVFKTTKRTARLAAAALSALTVLVGAGEADALTPAQIRCRESVSELARDASYTTLMFRMGCIRRRVHDGLSLTVDCSADPEELGGPGTGDLETDRRLARLAFLREEAGAVLTNQCDGAADDAPDDIDPVDLGLDDLCGGSADWNAVGACAVDTGIRAIDHIMEMFDLQIDGAVPASHERCLGDIARQLKKTVGALARMRSFCFYRDDVMAEGGGVLDCGATVMPFGTVESTGEARVDKRLAQPFPRLDDQLKRKCDLPIEELGFVGTVPDVTGGRFAGRITLDDVIHGLNDQIQEAVHALSFGTDGSDGIYPVADRGGYCGDGTADAGEACDDGNNVSCDGCDRDCTASSCGNGAVCGADGEECDDGNNVAGDGCSDTCISELCLNGRTNPGYDEECDDGTETFTCDTDCTFAVCGDGYNNAVRGEICDTGIGVPTNSATCDSDCTAPTCLDGHFNPFNTNPPALGSGEECDGGGETLGCDLNCTIASCGDGDVNTTRGENCDDNDNDADDSCVSSDSVPGSNCRSAFCGDGFHCTDGTCTSGPTGGTEVCDDGDGTPGSAQSADCDDDCSTPVCNDGNLNEEAGEACDAGPALTTNAHPCTAGCRVAVCGDGLACTAGSCTTGPSGGSEQCDDGNGNNRDACRNNCANATCGDSIVCSSAGCTSGPAGGIEQCDTGGQSNSCDTDCSVAFCGDSTTNAARGEQCDTGGDSMTCDSNCTTAQCRDGYRNAAAGEACDDGNNTSTDLCTNGCAVAQCGDSIVCSHGSCNTAGLGPETCDGGGETALCDSNCTAAACGDGTVNLTANEECDTSGESTSCDTDCSAAFCGDGDQNSARGETCDDGDDNNNDSCPDDVTTGGTCLTATCGDGFLCTAGGCNTAGVGAETCDDGDADVNDPCPSGGSGTCIVATCGDGFVCTGAGCTTGPSGGIEQCDDGNGNGNGPDECRDGSGIAPACSNPFCGDGIVDSGESCDDGLSNGAGEGFCISDCSAVQTCGNNVTNGTETCDDGDLEQCGTCNTTCSGAGIGSDVCGDGTVCGGSYGETCDDGDDQQCGACNATCDGAGIGPDVCGDGVVCGDGYGEECDDNNVDAGDGCSALCLDERIVFQTADTFTSGTAGATGFNSLASADARCQSAAAAAGLTGTYMAWLSDASTGPATRFTAQGAGPYMLVDGTYVADSWTDLTDGSIDSPINLDEDGNPASGGNSACTTVFGESAVWSNTGINGATLGLAGSCVNWTSASGVASADFGNGADTNNGWTASCNGASCGSAENLYCFEQ